MADEITLQELAPFVAPVLLEAGDGVPASDLFGELASVIADQAGKSSERTSRKILQTLGPEEDGDLISQAVIYEESAPPSWYKGSALDEKRNQLIVFAVRGSKAALCATDSAMRDRIVDNLALARPMPRDTIRAFVGGEAKALWLNGIHTPTSSKADTKTLTGSALEDALDPIGDQSYYYSAARTIPRIEGLKKNNRDVTVGAAPAGGRIWVRRAAGWDNFKEMIKVIFDVADHPPAADDPFALLSQPMDSIDDVTDAYGLALVPPELMTEDYGSEEDRETARRWAYDASYAVTALAEASLSVAIELDGQAVGNLELQIGLEEGETTLTPNWTHRVPGMDALCDACEAQITDLDRIKIFYDSGHALAQGQFYDGGYVDQQFDWDFHSFDGYSIGDEKPTVPAGSTLADRIAQHGDNSLFAYVVEKLFVDDEGNPTGWLASDDGSMEAADFIHISNDGSVVSLVHVKAASNPAANREAAPADYEVVVGQAVKNLRYLERRQLADELEKGKLKKIGAAVWHDGVKQANRDGLIAQAKKLKARVRKQLFVLQPRISRTERDYCWSAAATANRAKRIRQVETLMLAARISAQACGASFIGITADD